MKSTQSKTYKKLLKSTIFYFLISTLTATSSTMSDQATYLCDDELHVARDIYKATYKDADKLQDLNISELLAPLTDKNLGQTIKMQQRFLDIVQEYCLQLNDSRDKKTLLASIHHQKNQGVDGLLKDEYHNESLLILRVLAAASSNGLSPEEEDLFEFVPGSYALFALFGKMPASIPSLLKTQDGEDIDTLFKDQDRFAWQHSNIAISYHETKFKTKGTHYVNFHDCHQEGRARAFFKETFGNTFTKKPYWPMLGATKIGLSTLVKCMLDGIHVLPLPLPSSAGSLKAHGVQTSPLALTFHDFLHSLQDQRMDIAKTWTSLHAAESTKLSTYKEAIPQSVAEGKKRYDTVMGYFKDIFKTATQKLIQDQNKESYNQSIVPIYLALHEAYTFNSTWMDKYDDKDFILKDAVEKTKRHFEKTFLADNNYEEALTGTTINKDLKGLRLRKIAQNEQPMNHHYSEKPNLADIFMDDSVLEKNSMYTYAKIVLNSGKEYLYVFPNKSNIERDLSDFTPLLKISGHAEGINFDMPLYDQREIIVQNFERLLDSFLNTTTK